MKRLDGGLWKVEDLEENELFRGSENECGCYCKTHGFRFTRWINQRTLVLC
jgi:hypothetical protein